MRLLPQVPQAVAVDYIALLPERPKKGMRYSAEEVAELNYAADMNRDADGFTNWDLVNERVRLGDYPALRARLPRDKKGCKGSKVLRKKYKEMGGLLRPLWGRETGREEYAKTRAPPAVKKGRKNAPKKMSCV